MDPTACFKEMCDAFENGDLATARDRAKDLSVWLQKGGFLAEVYPAGHRKLIVDAVIEYIFTATGSD